MKENVLDVLMYLFENYFHDEHEEDPDQDDLYDELSAAGFPVEQIDKAFDWLEAMAPGEEIARREGQTPPAVRIYDAAESALIDAQGRGFLHFLEQIGVLGHTTREMVIDRAAALDVETIEFEQLKWVILLVLFNQPGEEASAAWMEEYLFDRADGTLH